MIIQTFQHDKNFVETVFNEFRGTHQAVEGLTEKYDIPVHMLEDFAIQAFEDQQIAVPSAGGSSGITATQCDYVMARPVWMWTSLTWIQKKMRSRGRRREEDR